tara:strand:+ start:220 stop:420 length:201 start_codon:yes stop_codon:yes gene_type:complete
MTNTEKNIIIAVWNNMVLRNRMENDPYRLTQEELSALKQNDELEILVGDTYTFKSTHTKKAAHINM